MDTQMGFPCPIPKVVIFFISLYNIAHSMYLNLFQINIYNLTMLPTSRQNYVSMEASDSVYDWSFLWLLL